MDQKKIKIDRKLGLRSILLSWFFLILIPVILFDVALQNLFLVTENSNKILAKKELTMEMELFEEDVKVEKFLENEFSDFFSKNPKKIMEMNGAEIASSFKEFSGVKLAGTIIHGVDTSTLESVHFSSFLHKAIGRMPRAFTLRFLAYINNQPFRKLVHQPNFRKFKKYKDRSSLNKLRTDSESFFQKQFGLISPIPLLPEKTSVSVSSKLEGFTYFYYQPFYQTSEKDSPIESGILAIVRGCDIPLNIIMASAEKQNQNDLLRGHTVLNREVQNLKKINLHKISKFTWDSEGIHLVCPIPQNLIAHCSSNGQFYPLNINKITRNLPLLRITKPSHLIQHPLMKFSSTFKMLGKMFLILGSILFLRISLFGLDFRLGIRQKVFMGIILAGALPMGLLMLSFSTLDDFSYRSKKMEAGNVLKQKVEKFQKRLNNFVAKTQIEIFSISKKVSEMGNEPGEVISRFVDQWLAGSMAQEAHINFANRDTIICQRPEPGFIPSIKEEKQLMKLLATCVIDSIDYIYNNSEVLNENLENDFFKDLFFEARFVNSALTSHGRLLDMDQIKTLNAYSTIPLMKGDEILGLLALRYHRKALLERFFQEELARVKDQNIDFFYYLRDDTPAGMKLTCLGGKKPKIPLEKIELAFMHGSSVYWQSEKDLLLSYGIKVFPKFPLALIAVQKSRLSRISRSNFLIFAGLIYLIFLVAFFYKIFGQIYIGPISELANTAQEVKRGNLNISPDIDSSDEFFSLKLAFDQMILGIAQKEKLSQFVSKEVIQAVGQNTETSMRPGGEKIEATVMFAALDKFDETLKAGSGKEIVAMLDNLISAGDLAAERSGGVLDKVIGNTIMLVFRSNHYSESHAVRACKAAFALKEDLGQKGIMIKISLSSGRVVSGRIGDANGKLDFTVIGDTVNLAARLKTISLDNPKTNIIVSPSTIRAIKGLARLNFIKKIPIKGKSREYSIYELLELRL